MNQGNQVLQMLKNNARQENIKFSKMLHRFFIEQFLVCLGKSRYREKLILRGGYLVDALCDFEGIHTGDLDFLFKNSIDMVKAEKMLNNIASLLPEYISLKIKCVNENDINITYKGYNAILSAEIMGVTLNFKVNIGMGDILFHQTEELEISCVTGERATICVYPVESIIAEKLDIITRRFELGDTMKHLYDILLLAKTFDFDGLELQRAVNTTLKQRKNDCGKNRFEKIASTYNSEDLELKWKHFARVNEIEISFYDAINTLTTFLKPVWDCINLEKRWDKNWSGNELKWQDPIYLY